MDGVNILATEAVPYTSAGRIIMICFFSLICLFGIIIFFINITDDDSDGVAAAVGSVIISTILLLLAIFTRPQKIYYYMTIQDTVNYIEFSEEYNVEKKLGELYIATKVEKDD